MDRLRPALLIAALVVDVGRRLPRRCGSAVPPSGRLVPAGKSGSVDVAAGTVIGGVGRPAPVPSAHFSCPTVPS